MDISDLLNKESILSVEELSNDCRKFGGNRSIFDCLYCMHSLWQRLYIWENMKTYFTECDTKRKFYLNDLTKKTPSKINGRVKQTKKVATPVMKSGESVSVWGHSRQPYSTMLPSIT